MITDRFPDASTNPERRVDAVHGPAPASDRLLLKPHEAAAALAISARKLWELTNTGDVPSIRIGRSLRYTPEDLRHWIASHRRGTRYKAP